MTAGEYQNIVVVGGSVAGHNLVNSLWHNLPGTHRILLIDQHDYAYWPIASLRGSVVPGWETKVTTKLSTKTVFPAGTPNQVIAPNRVIKLNENSLVLEKPFEGSTEVPFFKCVIATGSLQPSPMRPPPSASLEEAHAILVKYQQEISKATKVVVVGGGPVGSEIAGEIRHQHPDIEITVVHDAPHLIQASPRPHESSTSAPKDSWKTPKINPKLGAAIEKVMQSSNISYILSDRVVVPKESDSVGEGEWNGTFGLQNGVKKVMLASGKTLEADFVFLGVGNKFNDSLVEEADKEAVVGGMVWVDEYLRIKSTNPNSILTKNYFAIGDCCSSPGSKTAMTAQFDGEGCAPNIINAVKGRKLKPYKPSSVGGYMITLGPEKGAGYLTFPLIGDVFMPHFMMKSIKYQDLLVKMVFQGRFKGEVKGFGVS